jgi:hypothetical protein
LSEGSKKKLISELILKYIIMKRIIFSALAVIAFAGTSFSQKATLDNPWSLEGVLSYTNPGGINWSAPSIRARYFVNENIAARVQLGIGDGLGTPRTESYTFNEFPDSVAGVGTQDITRASWMAQIGAEYHLKGTDRMSPYFGLGINFGGGSEKQSWDKFDGTGYNANVSAEAAGSFSMFGVGLIAGMDFYVYENIYLGVELGLNFSSYNYSDVTTDVTTPLGVTNVVDPGYKIGYLSKGAGSVAFRLGWRF